MMEMIMPANYVEMTDDEMMYVEGGYQYYKNVQKTNYKYSGWYY